MPQNYCRFVTINSMPLLLSGALYGQYDTMRDLKPNATVSQLSIQIDTKSDMAVVIVPNHLLLEGEVQR